MKQKIQYIIFIAFAMLMLLPFGESSASASTVFDIEGRNDMNDDYYYSQTKDGYTLQLQSSDPTDELCLYLAGNYPYSNMIGDCLYIASSGLSDPKGVITVSAVGGKVFSLNSILCASDYSGNISITTGDITEDFKLIQISNSYGGTITPSAAFQGIKSFTLSWDNGCPMCFDNFDISFDPVITSQPSNTSVQTNENASFSVAAVGNGLTYQWQVDTTGSGFVNLTNGGVYSGTTSSTLSITEATKEMKQDQYRCIVKGEYGLYSNSNSAVLTVISRPPTDITLDVSSVEENKAVSTKVGSFTSTDADSSSFTYSLADTSTYQDNKDFTISSNELLLDTVPDYETKKNYNIRVRTTDDDGLTYDKNFTITVTDQNDAPTDIVLTPSGIPENSPIGTVIGTLSGVDQDTSDILSYELVAGEGDTDNSIFSLSGNELKLNFVPDYETKSAYSVRMKVSDGALSYEKSLPIIITNANEEPDGLVLSNPCVMENSSVGSVIGTLTGSDPDSGSVLTYSLTTGTGDVDNGCFSISDNVLMLRSVPDFEVKNSYSIRIGVSDGQYTYSKEFTIIVLDGNDPPTDITLTGGTIPENSASGTTAGTLEASDPNMGDVCSYALTAGTGDDDNASFTISGNELKLQLSPDYETKSSYKVLIRATDSYGLSLDKVFVISISNENEPPTGLTLTKAAIAENEPVGSVIGSFITTDPDTDSVFNYSFVAGAGDVDNDSFLIAAGELKLKFIPDYETKNSYSIRVRVNDGSSSLERQFTITIQDGNDVPTDITITQSSVNEKAAPGTIVATLLTTDSNVGDTFHYTLANGTGDADNNSFQISGDNLLITKLLDYETKSSYEIRIRTTDQGEMYYEKSFVITLNDINEAPDGFDLSNNNVDENSPIGTVIGTLSGTDPDAGDTLTYSLVAGAGDTDNASFVIDENKLITASNFNYEAKPEYCIRVCGMDQGGLVCVKIVIITVKDINEAPTDISLSNTVITENTAAGTTIGTLSGSDPDAGASFSYTLTTGTGDTNNSAFIISGNELKLAVIPNYETKATYSIRVRISDGALTYEKQFTITITDINEAPTAIALTKNSINENTPSGEIVAGISSTDEDSSSFTYTLVAGTGSTDNASFLISGNELKLAVKPDYEHQADYHIRIRSTDNGGSSFEKAFTISVNDLNEAPTDISLSNTAIAENTAAGTTIGILSGSDQDAGATLSYTLTMGTGDTDNSAFTISGNELKFVGIPDYEAKASYNIRVRISDGALTYEKQFTITITDINEAPTAIALTKNSINENTPSGGIVADISSTDEDSSSFTYTLAVGTGSTDNASFLISGNELKLAVKPDYEHQADYHIRIRSTDNGGSSFEKAFTISVNDLNEAPTDISLSNTAIAENTAAGTTIGTLSGSDADAGATLSYTLAAGTGDIDNSSFIISGNELKLAVIPDYETKASYNIRVRISDGALTYDRQFTITITDINEAPTAIALTKNSINENTPSGGKVADISSTDEDSSSFTYTLVVGTGSTDNASFLISGNELKLAVKPDYEHQADYHIRIRSTDNGGSSFEKAFTISVNDLNEASTDISLSNTAIAENTAAGATIGTLSGNDPDAGATFSYTLTAGTGDTDNSAFTISDNELKFVGIPDYETKASYNIRVKVSDGALTYDKQFTITITDINEAPTDITLTKNSINENTPSGGIIARISSTDEGSSSFTYTLAVGTGSTDNASFLISGNELKLLVKPDYEHKADYHIRIRSTNDGGSSFEKAFIISINDLNEAPTDISLSNTAIAENTAAGTTIGILSGSDADAEATFSYTLAAGTGDTDNSAFTISDNELKFVGIPDYETKASYNIRVKVSDGALTYDKQFTITITDINEAPTDIALTKNSINENTPSEGIVAGISSTDGDSSSFTYTLAVGTGSTDNASFLISGNKLESGYSFDYESKRSYSVRIRTTDAGGLFFEKVFTITINDVDETQPTITQPPTQQTPEPVKPDNESEKKVEKLTVDVAGGTGDISVAKVETERTTASDGTIKDSITFEQATTAEIIDKLKQEKSEEIRILASDSKEKVSEVKLTIPQNSLELISDTELKLELETTDARISIPNSSLATAGEKMEEELFFTVKPVTDKEEKQELSARANKDAMLLSMMGNDISPIGNPVEISTNMPQSIVDIILPLTGITIPDDKKEREILQNKLAVYVEHSDGEKETLKGEIVKISDGQYGLKFSVSKFSTFVIIKDERVKSDACKVLKVKSPQASIDGQLIKSKVAYETGKVKLQVTVSKGATWKIYSNKACTKEIKNNLKLRVGLTKVYIKVTAQDGVNNEVYTVAINRNRK